MTVIDDCPVTCGPEPGAAEALFKEAKRCERRRRLFTAATVILLVVAGTIAASIGAGGHSRASRRQQPLRCRLKRSCVSTTKD